MILRTFFLLLVAALSACAGISTVTVGEISEPIDTSQIKLFYSRLPDCEFETVAWISAPGEYRSQESVITSMRYTAASLGATALQVISVQKSGSATYRGTARALRCLT